jgi:hypothetical protein
MVDDHYPQAALAGDPGKEQSGGAGADHQRVDPGHGMALSGPTTTAAARVRRGPDLARPADKLMARKKKGCTSPGSGAPQASETGMMWSASARPVKLRG